MTVFPESQYFLIYMAFYGAFLTCSVPGDRNNFFDKTARTFLNKQSSLKNCAESESVIKSQRNDVLMEIGFPEQFPFHFFFVIFRGQSKSYFHLKNK